MCAPNDLLQILYNQDSIYDGQFGWWQSGGMLPMILGIFSWIITIFICETLLLFVYALENCLYSFEKKSV